jgi:hypothetical protein
MRTRNEIRWIGVRHEESAAFAAGAEAQAKGFGLFMMRAVLSGRGDEFIHLTRVNLIR